MRAGDLRYKIGFYARQAADSPDYGSPEGEFSATPEFTCAGNIKPRLGGESVLAQRQTGTNLVNITVRVSQYTSQVNEGWKAKDEHSGVEYNIRSIIDPYQDKTERGRWLEMLCERGSAL